MKKIKSLYFLSLFLLFSSEAFSQILGQTSVQQGSTHSYVDMTNVSPTWQVSGGQILSSGPSGCDVLWHTKGQGSILHSGVTLYVNVIGDLTPGSIGGAKTICFNTSAGTLNNVVNAAECGTRSYGWEKSSNNSSWSSISGATGASYSPGNLTATTYYRRKVTGSCGQTKYTNSQKITVKSLPNVSSLSFDGAGTFCNGMGGTLMMFDINGTSGYNADIRFHLYKSVGGSWVEQSYKNLAASSSTSPLQIVFNTDHPNNPGDQNYKSSAGNYKVKIMQDGCFVGWSREQEIFLAQPIGLNVPTVTYYKCPGETISIGTSENDGELYAFSDTNNNYQVPGYSKSGGTISGNIAEGTYYAGRSSSGECVSRSRTQINVIEYDTPGIPSVDPTVATQSQCIDFGASTTATFSVNTVSGMTYRWYTASTGGSLLGTGSGFTTQVLNSTSLNTYYVRAYKECPNLESTAKEVSINLTVGPNFSSLALSGGGTYCMEDGGHELELYDVYGTQNYPPDILFTLYKVEGDGTHHQQAQKNMNASQSTVPGNPSNALHIIFNADGASNPTGHKQVYPAGHYRVKAEYSTCSTWVGETDINLQQYEKPDVPTVSYPNYRQSKCVEQGTTTSFVFAVDSEANTTYRWYEEEEGGDSFFTGPGLTTAPMGVNAVPKKYFVRAYKECESNESNSTEVSARVYEIPQVTISDQQVFEDTRFSVIALAGTTGGSWSGTVLSDNQINARDFALGQHPIALNYEKNGCSITKNFQLEVIPNPTIELIGYKTLKPNRNVQLELQNADANLTYTWLKDDLNYPNNPPGNAQVIGNNLHTQEKGKYKLKATNAQGYEGLSNSIVLSDPKAQTDLNYVRARQLKVPVQTEAEITDPLNQESSNYQYVDGIGRSVQTVAHRASPNEKDVISGWELDEVGRTAKTYLPMTGETDGHYKSYFEEDQHGFYQSAQKVAHDSYPFSETTFENSSLNRPLKTYAPGQTWAKDNGAGGKPVTFGYEVNTADDAVILWKVENEQLKNDSKYDSAKLHKSVTTDENGKQVQEFKNLRGQVILKKVQLSETTPVGDDDWLQTYYVYDDFGNLRFVLPPMGTKYYLTDGQYVPDGTPLITEDANFEDVAGPDQKVAFLHPAKIHVNKGTTLYEGADIYSVSAATDNFILNSSFVDRWAFQYRYDERQRMIMKRVSGADSVLMVYDDRDRLVMTQDGNQRASNEWLFTKYDQLNRPVLTGIITDARSRTDIQTEVGGITDYSEDYSGTGALLGYNGTGYPTTAIEADVLTVTYYDNYDFADPAHSYWTLGDYTTESQAKTLVTGGKIRVNLPDGTYDWNETVTLYDSRYRVSSIVSKDYQDNKDTFVNTYRNLVHARLDQTVHTHESQLTGAATTTAITMDYDYDHADRLLKVTHTLDVTSDPAFVAVSKVIVENEYNELGELITKKLNRESDEGQPEVYSQSVQYDYNIRGWLTKINDPVTPDAADYFNMQLKYDETGQYNGNIGATSWKNPFETATNSYAYTYDPVNRLQSATYNSGQFSVPNIDYDANGNITALHRKGLDDTGTLIDQDHLDYDYVGNQLTKVDETGSGSKTLGFKDGADATEEYVYDANGNMVKDLNKGIDSIIYNHLNLPIKVDMQVGAGEDDRIEYIYDAAGIKLAQIVYEGGTETKRTDYQGAFIYEAKGTDPSQLQFIQHEEGRIVYNSDPVEHQEVYEYQYHLKDHLGNVRATFKEAGQEDDETLVAYMEDDTPNDLDGESGYFFNYENIKIVDVAMLNSTPNTAVAGASQSMRLSGSDNEQFGLNRQIKVKPGDKIDVSVQAKYLDPAVSSADMTNLTNTIVGQIGTVGVFSLVEGALSPGGIGAVDFTGRTEDETAPMAFLNAFVFDEHFNQKNLLSVQISSAAREDGSGTSSHESMTLPTIDITESGYVYIYLSNEQATLEAGQPIEVFFDDLTVTQHHTPIVSKDDYYPFGLTFASYNRPASTSQNFKYNSKEYVKDLGLNWYDYGARFYDAALGRWHVMDPYSVIMRPFSPYAYAFNNPVKFEDKDGFIPWIRIFGAKRKAILTSGFGPRTHPVTGEKKKFHNGADLWAPEGTKVRSLAGGKVVRTGSNSVSGNFVVVDHGHGYVTKYAHLKNVNVKKGSKLYDGQKIGTVGKTGRATGPHTHLILEVNGVEVDPTSIQDLAELVDSIDSIKGVIGFLEDMIAERKKNTNENGELSRMDKNLLEVDQNILEKYLKMLEDETEDDENDSDEEEESDDDESEEDEE